MNTNLQHANKQCDNKTSKRDDAVAPTRVAPAEFFQMLFGQTAGAQHKRDRGDNIKNIGEHFARAFSQRKK